MSAEGLGEQADVKEMFDRVPAGRGPTAVEQIAGTVRIVAWCVLNVAGSGRPGVDAASDLRVQVPPR